MSARARACAAFSDVSSPLPRIPPAIAASAAGLTRRWRASDMSSALATFASHVVTRTSGPSAHANVGPWLAAMTDAKRRFSSGSSLWRSSSNDCPPPPHRHARTH